MAEVDYEDIELHKRLRATSAVITQQLAEIERLRAAGDALVESLDHSRADIRSAVAAWEEARRG